MEQGRMAVASAMPEGIELILDALKYGGLAMAVGALEQAGADIYSALVRRLREIFGGRRDGNLVLERYVEDPETWAVPLRKELEETGAASDTQIADAARQVMTIIGKQVAAGKFNVAAQHIGQVYQAETMQFNVGTASPTSARLDDNPVGNKAFEQLHKPKLIQEGWEVSLTTLDKLDLRLAAGWEEVTEQTQDGTRRRMVILHPITGVIDAIPIRRDQLSADAMKLLVAALEHGGTKPHSLWFREYIGPNSPTLGSKTFTSTAPQRSMPGKSFCATTLSPNGAQAITFSLPTAENVRRN